MSAQPVQQLTISIADAAAMSGLSYKTIYRRIASNDLESVKVGRRHLVNLASLKKLVGAE